MGYRSTVYIGIENRPECKALIDACKDAKPDVFDIIEGDATVDLLQFQWDYTKWYESFEEVGRVMKEVGNMEMNEQHENVRYHHWPFGMIIMGEEFQDIEYFGDPFAVGIQLNRELKWEEGYVI